MAARQGCLITLSVRIESVPVYLLVVPCGLQRYEIPVMRYRYLILPVFVIALLSAGCTDPKRFVEEKLVQDWKLPALPPPPLGPPLQPMKVEVTVSKAEDGFFTAEGVVHNVLNAPLYRAVDEPDFDAAAQWQKFQTLRQEMVASNLPMPPDTQNIHSASDLVMRARAEPPGMSFFNAVEAMPVGAPVEFKVGLSGVYDTKAKTAQVTSHFSPQMTPDLDAMKLITQQGLNRRQIVADEDAAAKDYLAKLSEAVEKTLQAVQDAAAATKAKYKAARAAFAPGAKYGGSYELDDRTIPVIFEVMSYDTKDDTFQIAAYDENDPDFRKQYLGVWKRPQRDAEIDGRELELQAAGRDGPLKSGLNTPALFEATSNVWEFQLDGPRLTGQLRNIMKSSEIKLERR